MAAAASRPRVVEYSVPGPLIFFLEYGPEDIVHATIEVAFVHEFNRSLVNRAVSHLNLVAANLQRHEWH